MASESKHIVLEARNLSVGYFRKKKADIVLSDIDFLLAEGELVALVGTNGIGKSTLLRTISTKMCSSLVRIWKEYTLLNIVVLNRISICLV